MLWGEPGWKARLSVTSAVPAPEAAVEPEPTPEEADEADPEPTGSSEGETP